MGAGSSVDQKTFWSRFVFGTGKRPTLAMEVRSNERTMIVVVHAPGEGKREDTSGDEDEEKRKKSVSRDEDEGEDERTLALDPKTKSGKVEEVLGLKQKRMMKRDGKEGLRQDWG